MTRFEVQRRFLDWYQVHQVGGRDVLEYWIPTGESADLNAHIVGVITEEADYRGRVGDQESASWDVFRQRLGRRVVIGVVWISSRRIAGARGGLRR